MKTPARMKNKPRIFAGPIDSPKKTAADIKIMIDTIPIAIGLRKDSSYLVISAAKRKKLIAYNTNPTSESDAILKSTTGNVNRAF